MIPLEGHTVKRFDGELNQLHLHILEMAGLVENQAQQALEALKKKDLAVAHQVMEREHKIDALEVALDKDILALLAIRSPVAGDLRVLMAFSKAVTDLERIGDEAARIANLALTIYDNERSDPSAYLLRDTQTIGVVALRLLEHANKALDILDVAAAHSVIMEHSELDAEFQSGLRRLTTFVLEDARNVGHVICVVQILKAYERIGDHARNLAEQVIFLVDGEDIRHLGSQGTNHT